MRHIWGKDPLTGVMDLYYELYVDRIFFFQFSMNLLLLMLTAAAAGLRTVRWRLIASSAAGALFGLAVFLLPLGNEAANLIKTLLQVGGTLLMLQFSFGFMTLGACLRAGVIYSICACLFGGLMAVLNRGKAQMEWQILLPAVLIALIGIIWAKKEEQRRKNRRYIVWLSEGECCLKVTALLDSGNSLFDPISKQPVCVVQESLIKKLGLYQKPERYRAIPYHSIGKKRGMLSAWAVENMYIQVEGQKRFLKRVLLAASRQQLSGTEEYQMLLHPALLEEKKGENHDFESCNAGKDAV